MFRKKLLRAFIVVRCRYSILPLAQSVLATPTTVHFVEISRWSTHDTMNYSDAPAKLDELQASHGFPDCRKNSRAELVPSPRAYGSGIMATVKQLEISHRIGVANVGMATMIVLYFI